MNESLNPNLPAASEIRPTNRPEYERKDWNEYSAAMRTIAAAFGTTVYCRKKFKRLAVDFRYEKLSIEQRDALLVVDQLVQLVSEFPEGYLVTLEPPNE